MPSGTLICLRRNRKTIWTTTDSVITETAQDSLSASSGMSSSCPFSECRKQSRMRKICGDFAEIHLVCIVSQLFRGEEYIIFTFFYLYGIDNMVSINYNIYRNSL